jgi:hypothetical protein
MRESERVEILRNRFTEQRFHLISDRMPATGASAATEAA